MADAPMNLSAPKRERPLKRFVPPLVLAGCYLFLFALHFRIQPYSDDIWYATEAAGQNFFALQAHYYLTWSGRVVSSALAFLLMGNAFWLWRLLNPLLVMALAFGMARAAMPKPGLRQFVMALLLLLCLGPGVMDYSVFWATGSLYYLWPTAAALFVMHPFLDLARALPPLRPAFSLAGPAGQAPWGKMRFFPARVALAVPACFGNEQLTLCLLGFMGCVLLEAALRTKRLPGRHLAVFLVAVACAAALFFAPGSGSRYQHESRAYRDEFGVLFTRLPLAEKLGNGAAWLFDILFTTLLVLLVLLFALALRRRWGAGGKGTAGLRLGLLALLGLLGLGVAFAFPARADAMFAFRPLGDVFGGSPGALAAGLAPYAFWGLFLAGIFCLLARQNRYLALGLAAALCTGVAMVFSPTIYFSGERTMFTAGVIFVVMAMGYYKEKVPAADMVVVGCLAATATIRLASRLVLFYG